MDGGFPQLYRNIYREKVKYQFACFGENRRNLTGFQICHSEERSDVGISPGLFCDLEVPSRDCTQRALPRASRSGRHVGLWPPRNDKSGTVIILSLPNTNRQHCAGPGCPLPYSALREAMGKTPLSTLNFRRPAGGYPRTGISSNPGRAPMPRRGSDCSRPDCAPRPPRATARCPAAGSARPTGHNTSRFP